MIGPFMRDALWDSYINGVLDYANGFRTPSPMKTEGGWRSWEAPAIDRARRAGWRDASKGTTYRRYDFEPTRFRYDLHEEGRPYPDTSYPSGW